MGTGAAHFAMSSDGALIYVSADALDEKWSAMSRHTPRGVGGSRRTRGSAGGRLRERMSIHDCHQMGRVSRSTSAIRKWISGLGILSHRLKPHESDVWASTEFPWHLDA